MGRINVSINTVCEQMCCNFFAYSRLSESLLLFQVVDLQWSCQTRPHSSASWALAPPNSLRYQNLKQPVLLHPSHHASQQQRGAYYEEDWEESLSVCVLVPQGRSSSLPSLQEIPFLLGQTKLAELLIPGAHKSSEFYFPLTTVDGSREDDISVRSFKRTSGDPVKREHGCFRSLFEAERCPAPFMYGSQFYCFHCPVTEPVSHGGLKSRRDVGLEDKPVELSLLQPTFLCSHASREGEHTEGDSEGEEKLALVYERLRMEV